MVESTNKTAFSIAILILTGAILGTYFGVFFPKFISCFPSYSMAHKVIQSIILSLYCILAISVIIGTYVWLNQRRRNIFTQISTVIFCITIGIDGVKYHFLPFSIDLIFNFSFSSIHIQLGINFLGVIFVIWYNRIRDIA